jgi:threonine dehydratase
LYDKVFFAGARASQWTTEQTKGGSEPRGSLKVGEYQATLDSDIVGAKAANGEKANDEKTQERGRDREMSTGAGQGSEKIRPDILTIREAQSFLAEYFAVTRLVGAPYLSERVGKRVYLKLEAELPTGSFKVRGALWALTTRLKRGRVEEVIASSTGNHGAAVAYAAKLLGVKARIFLPAGCNPVKRGRIASLGAEIVESGGADLAAAFALAAEYAKRPGVYFLNDATDLDLPAGPGTIGCEILEQFPDAGTIVVPMGDTALIRGIAAAMKQIAPRVRIIGVQAERAPAYFRSWQEDRVVGTATCDTIADGLATRTPDEANVRDIKSLVDDVALVSEEQMLRAIEILLIEEHVLAEPAGAASTAALLNAGLDFGDKVVLVVSGANISRDVLRRAVGAV